MRFGHNPDPAIDFEIEVESIQGMLLDLQTQGQCWNDDDTPSDWNTLAGRIQRAMHGSQTSALLQDLQRQLVDFAFEEAA